MLSGVVVVDPAEKLWLDVNVISNCVASFIDLRLAILIPAGVTLWTSQSWLSLLAIQIKSFAVIVFTSKFNNSEILKTVCCTCVVLGYPAVL